MNNLYDDPTMREIIGELKNKIVELKVRFADIDDQYPDLYKLFNQHEIQKNQME
jgi:hypothetical protein